MTNNKKSLFERKEVMTIMRQYRTCSLFWEYRTNNNTTPIMTLSRTPFHGLPSIYEEYMKFDTEYEAAMWILGDWKHWQRLCASDWFKEHKKLWDEEKTLRQQAENKKILKKAAEEGNITAAKFLYEDKRIPTKNSKGRPTKAQKEAAIKREIKGNIKISDITKRMKKFEERS